MMPESQAKGLPDGIIAAIDFALHHVDVCEDPIGSNRGPEIDEWCKEAGSPLGSYWCAIAVWKARKAGGLWVPTRDVGSCDEWVYQAFRANKVIHAPTHGAVVLYTNHEKLTTGRYAGQLDAVHAGLIIRVRPQVHAIEGNTTLGKYDRNGYVQTLKVVEKARVLCYIAP
jgi:hypothetical protein